MLKSPHNDVNVWFWHLADAQPSLTNGRFEGNNGHDGDETRCLLMTQIGHRGVAVFLNPSMFVFL